MKKGCPVISIDAKKKEIIGNFKNKGKEYHKKEDAPLVYDHDFLIAELGKATSYSIYDIFRNAGFVNVGLSSDTAEFAAASVGKWWEMVGSKYYGEAGTIVITADSGGSNGYKIHLWKLKVQETPNLNI
jgi:hypothetical protein